MQVRSLAFLAVLLAAQVALADAGRAAPRVQQLTRNLPLHFEPNRGQFDSRVKFLSRAGGFLLYLEAHQTVLDVRRADGGSIMQMRLASSNPRPCMEGLEELPGQSHYFKGSDPERWMRHVQQFARVRVEEVYPGIDLVYYGNPRRLEFDFMVGPGADPGVIEIELEGMDDLALDDRGRAALTLPGGSELVLEPPVVYQETGGRKTAIPARYERRESRRLGVSLGSYDRSLPLCIDPTVGFSTFAGGSGYDNGTPIAVDSNGKVYVTGSTSDSATDYPTTGGAYDTTHNGGSQDAMVTKLAADGSSLEFSTFLGGTGADVGTGLSVDSNAKVYVSGHTADAATDYPTTGGAYDTTHNGGTDTFVTKLAADGASLEYSTFIGGNGGDNAAAAVIDSSDKVCVTGYTQDSTTDYPATVGAYDTTHNGGSFDAFVTRFAADGASREYATFLGGNGLDQGVAIAVDSSSKAYVTGIATDAATDFPTTGGAYDTTNNGATDVFVTKLAADGASLDFSTFIGGSAEDYGGGIDLDSSNQPYIVGYCDDPATDYPTTVGAYDRTFNGGFFDCVVTKLAANGSSLDYSSLLGGSGDYDFSGGVAVDGGGYAIVAGYTDSTDFPTSSAFQGSHAGGFYDGFVTCLRPSGAQLFYSSFHGGDGDDQLTGVAVDSSGNVYVTGTTSDATTDFPTTGGAYDTSHNGDYDVFVSKLSISGTAVRLLDLAAEPAEEGGTLVSWRTGLEVDNLGFHVWRHERGGWQRITSALVAGSGLLAGERSSLSGFSYSFLDAELAPGARYFLEEIDLAGARTWHGPANATARPGRARRSRARAALRAPSPKAALKMTTPAEALKLRVREEGWYRLRGQDLLAAGLPPDLDPRGLRLFTAGREVALRLSGAHDGRLDPEDTVEFYGTGLETPWEDCRVYRLVPSGTNTVKLPSGTNTARRVSVLAPRLLRSSPPPSTYTCELEQRERTIYFAALLNGDEENFFGALIGDDAVEETLEARDVVPGSSEPSVLTVSLQGVTDVPHRVSVSWNGLAAGTLELGEREKKTATFPVTVLEGENRLSLRSGDEADVSALETVRLSYERRAIVQGALKRALERARSA